jgi:E3 ubiquitin-protein ligase makorin
MVFVEERAALRTYTLGAYEVCVLGYVCMQYCERYALHPSDEGLRAEHADACRARHERLAARTRSADVECGICLERVLSKANPGDRKFGLLACEHAFCLGCIRGWRQNYGGGADVDSVRI